MNPLSASSVEALAESAPEGESEEPATRVEHDGTAAGIEEEHLPSLEGIDSAHDVQVREPAPEIGSEAAPPETGVEESTNALRVEPSSAATAFGPGIQLTNKSSRKHIYYFYDNYWNGNGEAGANFDHPLKHVEVGPNKTVHVPLSLKFKGRVQRGDKQPATWCEFQVKADNDGKSHGDISLQQGCDGAATVSSTDGTNQSNGFTKDIIKGAPAAALDKKPNGERVLAHTEPNWNGPGNKAAIDWEHKQLGTTKAYIVGGSGVPDVASKNNCLHFTFYVV